MPSPAENADQSAPILGLVVVAAGRGERAGAGGPKQYRPLAGRALIARTLQALQTHVPASRTCIVIHRDDGSLLAEALGPEMMDAVLVTNGGATRQASVFSGLEALARAAPEITHVMIHDAARPFVAHGLLDAISDALHNRPDQGVLPVLPIAETIKRVSDGGMVTTTVDRSGLHTAQTPQTFPMQAIRDVHSRAAAQARDDFTDDAALFEWAGLPVTAIAGDKANVKLTYARDFEIAEEVLMQSSPLPDIRMGNGYDVHRFGPGDHVMLCGVAIPHDRALSGHSDADVGLHALTDALLATCGAGDIGDHFPPTDPQWKGQASSLFAEHAASIVRAAGGTIMNADVSIVAEAPKIAPHRLAMRQRLAELLGIDLHRCSVKATTNERMGFVGRAEGIAAIATVSVGFRPKEPSDG